MASNQVRYRPTPLDAKGYTEVVVAVVGSVDSGKSTTIGTLILNDDDDGDGRARSIVFMHKHERISGRTSDISYQYMQDEKAKRIITFVDLAGHEIYLKTTLAGLTASMPDFAILCVSDKITKMTKEHMGLCYALKIPFIVLFTKCDIIPTDVRKKVIDKVRMLVTKQGSKFHCYRTIKDFEPILEHQNNEIIPYIITSNTKGVGRDLIKYALSIYNTRPRVLPDGFVVEHVYTVIGIGTVLSGISKYDIKIGDKLFMGPINGEFIVASVRSIHNDYRFNVQVLPSGKKGCIAVSVEAKKKKKKYFIRRGTILFREIPTGICNEFIAEVRVLHHATTIKPNYRAIINCGMLREPVVFLSLCNANGQEVTCVRSMDIVHIKMQFCRGLNYISVGQYITFREGTVRGIGKVVETIKPADDIQLDPKLIKSSE